MVHFETVPGFTVQPSCSQAGPVVCNFSLRPRAAVSGFASLASAFQTATARNPAFSLAEALQAPAKPEKGFRILKIQGDGRCMFRALAQGLSRNKGFFLSGDDETKEADELRLAVRDALCRTDKRKKEFKDAVFSLEATEGPIGRYCQRLSKASFWGGEVELLVLSKMLRTPIFVYKTAQEGGRADGGLIPIVRYGEEFSQASKTISAPRRPKFTKEDFLKLELRYAIPSVIRAGLLYPNPHGLRHVYCVVTWPGDSRAYETARPDKDSCSR